ncbi:hypothetical protein EKH55_5476 [Sinorhizobium alkalisoli]|nr:hypothetical protein EKH55_5476 [Sinorhizobium alkalisoli]
MKIVSSEARINRLCKAVTREVLASRSKEATKHLNWSIHDV